MVLGTTTVENEAVTLTDLQRIGRYDPSSVYAGHQSFGTLAAKTALLGMAPEGG